MKEIIISLVALMVTNILLGSTLASFKAMWNKEKFLSGIYKMATIIAGVSLMFLAAKMSPDIMTATINGIEANLLDGMKLIFTAGVMLYGGKCLVKLRNLIQVEVDVELIDGSGLTPEEKEEISKEEPSDEDDSIEIER